MQPGSALSFFFAMSLLMLVLGIPYGPAAAYLPEFFHTRYRYTGAGMSYNLAGILGGALPLLVAPPLAQANEPVGEGIRPHGPRHVRPGDRARAGRSL